MTEQNSMPVRIPNEQYESLKELRDEMGGVSTATYGEVIAELIDRHKEDIEDG